jgi:hypothetical protein
LGEQHWRDPECDEKTKFRPQSKTSGELLSDKSRLLAPSARKVPFPVDHGPAADQQFAKRSTTHTGSPDDD